MYWFCGCTKKLNGEWQRIKQTGFELSMCVFEFMCVWVCMSRSLIKTAQSLNIAWSSKESLKPETVNQLIYFCHRKTNITLGRPTLFWSYLLCWYFVAFRMHNNNLLNNTNAFNNEQNGNSEQRNTNIVKFYGKSQEDDWCRSTNAGSLRDLWIFTFRPSMLWVT